MASSYCARLELKREQALTVSFRSDIDEAPLATRSLFTPGTSRMIFMADLYEFHTL